MKVVPNPTLGGLLGTTSPEPEKVALAEDLDFSLSSSDNEAGSSNQASLESAKLSEGECSGSD